MTINETIINYELYRDGTRYLGTAELELPEINFKTVDVTGAGVAGELNAPVQGNTESLELKIKWRTIFKRPLQLMTHGAIKLQARAAVQTYDATAGAVKIAPLKIDFRGRLKSASLGTLKPAEQMENETTIELDYLKITYDGNTAVEIDKYSYIYKVSGVDFMSEVRKALGL